MRRRLLLLLIGLSVMGWNTNVQAQERLGVEPPRRLGPIEPPFPTPPPSPPLPHPVLPPVPPLSPEEQEWLPVPRVFVRQINVTGNTVFSEADLLQWGRRLGARDIQLLFRLDVQLATDPLLPLEQIAIGGRFRVWGYRENQLVRDNGLIVSLESHISLMRNTRWAEYVQLVPFVDFGRGWDQKVPTPGPENIGQYRPGPALGRDALYRPAAACTKRDLLGL